jgi:sugar phosphate isomerase/epimerase
MMAETRPDLVCFEMDIFWIVHAGQDPVKLFDKYGSRFQLTHLKGMKDSTPTGLLTGHSDVTNDVPLGQGKINLAAVLQAAEKAGVKWQFIEDESPSVEVQIPQSLRYLEQLQW